MTKLWSFCPQRILAALILTAFFVVSAGLTARSQTSGAGSINGTVADPNQAVIPNAQVTVTDTDTGVSHQYTTNAAGLYSAPFLVPGHYEIDASAANFGKVETKGITLLVGQTLTINLTLKVSTTTTTVEVEGTNQILDTDKTEVSQVVDSQLVANLPVAVRNWSEFVLLTPNVTQDGSTGLVSFHGISGLYNQNYVDGGNNNQMLFSEARGRSNGVPYVYSVDSIKEFQAETSNYSVEFGQSAGGQVNAITRSGTDNLHGDLFYYLRYPDLNALDPYSKYIAINNPPTPAAGKFLLTQPIHQQNQFGGSVGGPIIKDRLFYFFTYDGFRQVGNVLYTDSNQISTTASGTYDPTVKANASLVTPNQCPTASNASYATYLTANKLPAYYVTDAQCSAAITFLANTSTAAPRRFSKENLFFPRVDYHVNSKNDAFVDFNFVDFDKTYGYNGANTNSNGSPSNNAPTSYHERILVGGLTTVVSQSAVNTVHFQWGRDLETAGANASGPFVSMGVDSYGMVNAIPRVAEPDEHRFQVTDVFSRVIGRHNLKFGGDFNNVHEVMINLFQGGGLYSYGESTSVANFQDWIFDAFQGQAGDTDPYAGFHYNTFVQTVDAVNTKPGTQGKDDFYMNMFDVFGEDNWKANRYLTVTAGLRWDAQFTPPPGLVNNNYAPLSTQYTQSIKNVLDRVQPRVGFSWSPFGGTVVRGGYGLFSALNQGSTYYADRVENGVVQINYNYTGCLASVGSVANAKCPTVPSTSTKLQFPDVPFQPTGPSLSNALYPSGGSAPKVSGPTTLGPQSFHGLDPNFVPPFAHEFELSLEQAMPGTISLSVGYVGTRGMRLPVFLDSNLIGQQPHGIRTYNVLSALATGATLIKQMTVPVYLPTDRRNTSLASFNTGFSVANTWYNAMAVTAKRPFRNGVEVLANYTWAHASDDGQVAGSSGTFYGGDIPLDPNNVRLENGPSDTDVRNRFTLSFVYQPQFMLGNKLMKIILDDFRFSGDEIATGGEPIYLGSGLSGTIYSGSTSASSYAADGGIYGGAMSSSSGLPTNGRPPQIGRNSIYAPGFNNVDFRVTRDVPIHENIKMQFVGEAFNLLNHTIISSVNSTYSSYTAAGTTGGGLTCANSGATPTGSVLQGCIYPYTGTGLNAFRATSGTNSYLYSARQLQVSAKLFF